MAETTTTVPVVGDVAQGVPLRPSEETVMLHAAILEAPEQVYRVADASLGVFDLCAGDLVVVAPKQKAETGELVLTRLDGQLFVGRWWAKHGRRDLLGADGQTIIVRGAMIVGSINLIVRAMTDDEAWDTSPVARAIDCLAEIAIAAEELAAIDEMGADLRGFAMATRRVAEACREQLQREYEDTHALDE
jgi:hypothetical protein